MSREDEMMEKALQAYEESTNNVPDVRDFVALEDAVKQYVKEEGDGSN